MVGGKLEKEQVVASRRLCTLSFSFSGLPHDWQNGESRARVISQEEPEAQGDVWGGIRMSAWDHILCNAVSALKVQARTTVLCVRRETGSKFLAKAV